jgi:hypothetical protein
MNWRALAVALAVVLAGCGSVVDGESPDSGGPTPTLTPAPVPTVTEPAPTLPPGVTGDSVSNATALYAAHTSYLRGRSYTLRVRVRVDESTTERLFRVETPTRYVRHDVLPGRNFTQFADGDVSYLRSDLGGNRLFGRSTDVDPPTAHTVRLSKAYLQLDAVRVAETRVDGELAYELTGQYPVHPALDSFRNVTIRAVVHPRGLLRSVNVTYVSVEDGTETRVTRSFAYTAVDATTVERPAWVDREFDAADGTGTPTTI